MSGGAFFKINKMMSGLFAERRVYIRSESGTRYWTFSPVWQAGASLVVLAFFGWCTFTTLAFIDKATDGRTAENRLGAQKEAYEIQLSAVHEQQRLLEVELNRSNLRGDAVTAELSGKQQLLVSTSGKLLTAEAELTGLRAEFERVVARDHESREMIAALNAELSTLRLAMAEAEHNRVATADTMKTLSDTMNQVIAQRDSVANRASVLDERLALLEDEITGWEDRQEDLVARLEDATSTSLTSLSELFVGSDVNLDSILDQAKRDYTGRGGGPVDDDAAEAREINLPDQEEERLAALTGDLERMSLMRVAIDRLPFGIPTKGARRTSGFGPRRDPMRRSYRMHSGMDFAAPRGTPIFSTGEGVVSFSGRQSGYGIVVKIRHAFGFETVYAHLNKSRVKVGQRVERGERIADMGSTGRSTGSHLHYEIRIDGKPVNPNKFIKAARNVL